MIFTTNYEDFMNYAPGKIIKNIMGDCSAKIGRETSFIPTFGTHSVHEIYNNNE